MVCHASALLCTLIKPGATYECAQRYRCLDDMIDDVEPDHTACNPQLSVLTLVEFVPLNIELTNLVLGLELYHCCQQVPLEQLQHNRIGEEEACS